MTAAVRLSPPAEDWLEAIDADSPILLIAPHGGRAGDASRATLHPKVNDLHTADITRDLARRLGASALINHAMDRNRLDCNRTPQLAAGAPWMLTMIAERLAHIVDRHERATVLVIHGWNIIEPRVDFGLGLRNSGGELRPPGAAHVSATDEFINGPLTRFASRLREHGIKSSFGMRYPAGGSHNLVQAFTARHRESDIASLADIANIAARGLVDAAQFELSVALRMPGPIRERCIGAMVDSFALGSPQASDSSSTIPVVRISKPRPVSAVRIGGPPAPARVGIEFFDRAARIGAMASFDLGPGGFGARIMMLLGERRVMLCTCEGRVTRSPDRVALGPLALAYGGGQLELAFDGPAVIVPDSTAYLSIERALASGKLDPHARVKLRMALGHGGFDPAAIFTGDAEAHHAAASSAFGAFIGEATIEGATTPIHAIARAGVSFTGLGPQKFRARRMIWASFDGVGHRPTAIELRMVGDDGTPEHRSARMLSDAGWSHAELGALEIETEAVDTPPHRLAARFTGDDRREMEVTGRVAAFVPLSRPGPDLSRIYTAMGFANFRIGKREGAGMFEYSRRVDAPAAASLDDDSESD